MRVDVEHRPFNGSIWLKRGTVSYGANWCGAGVADITTQTIAVTDSDGANATAAATVLQMIGFAQTDRGRDDD